RIARATAVTFNEGKLHRSGRSAELTKKKIVLSNDTIITEEEEEVEETDENHRNGRSSTTPAIIPQVGQPSEQPQAITVNTNQYNDQSNDHVGGDSSSGEHAIENPPSSRSRKSSRPNKGKAASRFDEQAWS